MLKLKLDNNQWPIIQSTFLQQKAKVKSYTQQVTLSGDVLHYTQNMMLDIYGRSFDHNDTSTLIRVIE